MDNAENLLRYPQLLELSNYSFAKNTSITSLTFVAGAGSVSYALDEITCAATVDTATLTETLFYSLDPINVSVTVDDATIVATDPHALVTTDISVSVTVDAPTCFEDDALHPETENWTVLVLDQSGSNVFYLGPAHLDGDYRPVLSEANLPWMLQRGTTYVFDVSLSSNSGHPFRFRDENDNPYTTGVTVSGTEGTSGATVTFDVPLDAPDTLKYYCTVHGNAMGNFIYPAYRDVTVSDVTVDNSALIQQIVFTFTDISCASSVDNSSISQIHNSTLEEVNVGVAVDSSVITQVHDISLTEIDASVSVDDSICVENVALISTNIITGAASVDNSSITETHNLLSLSIDCRCIVDEARILGSAALSRVDIDSANDLIILDSLTSVLLDESNILAEVA